MNGGETKEHVSGWTTDTLHAHINALLTERDLRYEQRFEGAKEAVTKAENAAEKRFQGVNEFRAQLADQQRTFIPRTEVQAIVEGFNRSSETRFSTNAEKIMSLEKRFERMEGRGSGLHAGWGYLVGVMGLVAAIIGIVIALK